MFVRGSIMPDSNIAVTVQELGSMRVASVRVISATPERDSWARMKAWAAARGLLDLKQNPIFGFNSPDPEPRQSVYGYEYWMKVDGATEIGGDAAERHFDGGLYAVATCRVSDPWKDIPSAWGSLLQWALKNGYSVGPHQYFEVPEDPDAPDNKLVLRLYCPIAKK